MTSTETVNTKARSDCFGRVTGDNRAVGFGNDKPGQSRMRLRQLRHPAAGRDGKIAIVKRYR